MQHARIEIIPSIHGKITRDGKMSEPDIYWIMEVISASISWGEDIADYDPAQDVDLYEYFLADDDTSAEGHN